MKLLFDENLSLDWYGFLKISFPIPFTFAKLACKPPMTGRCGITLRTTA